MHCCRLAGVVSHGSIYRYHSKEPGGSAAEGTPRETQSQDQAIDVQTADVQSDQQPQFERVAHQAALQVVPTTHPTMLVTPEGVETGQPTQIDVYTACLPGRVAGQCRNPGSHSSGHVDRGAVIGVGDVTTSHTNHQAPAAGPETEDVRHTHCHHRWVKRRDSESLQAELAAEGWACLGPTLLVRAYDGSEHADNDGLTPGQRRKLSIELAGKRATSAETGAWTELLRLYVRGMLAREVDGRGDGTHTLHQEHNTEGGHDARL